MSDERCVHDLVVGQCGVDHAVRTGCMVSGDPDRHPACWPSSPSPSTTFPGRLEFGYRGDRLDRLEEACQIICSLWTQERTTFAGRHYQISDAAAEPKPVQPGAES